MPDLDGDAGALRRAAERLFAMQGVNGPSLREITAAADVRHKSAIQYHFTNREGLLAAVLASRGETLRTRRALAHERVVVAGTELDPRALCRVIVEPYCDFLRDDPGAWCYLVIADEVLRDPSRPYDEVQSQFNDPLLPILLNRLLSVGGLPGTLAEERALVSLSTGISSVATRARRQLDRDSPRALVPVDLFVANLIDMLLASTTAPPSATTLAVMDLHLTDIARPQEQP